jgi:hypothetical protein
MTQFSGAVVTTPARFATLLAKCCLAFIGLPIETGNQPASFAPVLF